MTQAACPHDFSVAMLPMEDRSGKATRPLKSAGLFSVLMLCCQFPAFGQFVLPPEFQPSSRTSSFSFDFEQHHVVLVPVGIGGATGSFVLDTGASHHLLDERYYPQLGKPLFETKVNTATPGVTTAIKAYRPPRMLVEHTLVAQSPSVGVHDCEMLSLLLDADIHGVLGAPILRSGIVTLDFDRGVGSIAGTLDHAQPPESSIAIHLDSSGRPCLSDVKIGEAQLKVMIDTGMTQSVALAPDQFQMLLDSGAITNLHTSVSVTPAGVQNGRAGTLDSITIGKFRHREISVGESRWNSIGVQYLSRFLVTFDVARRQLHLSKSAKFDEPEHGTIACGLGLARDADGVVVHSVDPGSPAADAGVLPGDRLLTVNGIGATGPSMMEALRLLRGDVGTTVQLVYRRGDVQTSVGLRIQPYADWGSG